MKIKIISSEFSQKKAAIASFMQQFWQEKIVFENSSRSN